ncbi:mediator of DNA damage checkpoint protein 1 isoform X7 [Saimiri boliviensis]|uniref:mediator of DNA damage checkpoint protein 1 isoform X7 n=1 Tax=Saimiri boliviensis TaxID=27679 RepID=UPI003D77AB2E
MMRIVDNVYPSQIMEDTQAIDWDIEEEEETEQSCESLGCNPEPVGRLRIFSGAHGPEKDFPLYLGKNVIGRMPGCSVALPFPSISKQHAEIEISAWDKAPILRDSGSLNGTQILRPPKVLIPGVSHRLRDQELILFADLPCQYRRVDVPLPFVSRGPLTVEETPRVQGGTQPQRLLLAEDSEEEVDSLSERCVVKKSRTTSSSMGMIVPDSDEEGNSPVLGGPGLPFAFNLSSDTDPENQQLATEEASSAARRGAAIEPEQSEAEVTTEIQLEKKQPSVKERDDDTEVKRGAGNGIVPAGVMLEKSQSPAEDSDTDVDDDSRPPGRPAEVRLERVQPLGFIDSDTDVEEQGIPATLTVVPMKKRKIFHGVGIRGPGGPGLAHLQESQAGSDTDTEEGKAPQAAPLEKSQASMVINSDTDDEEEVSAALTLARLKESQPALWNRDAEEDMAQPVVLLQRSQTTTGRDSDTDVEEEELPVENREALPEGHTKIRALVRAHSGKNEPSFRDSVKSVEADKSSPGIHLERSQASTTVDINTQVEESAMVSMQGTNQTDVEADSEDLDLQATQCFLERENQNLEVQSMEDEPTQTFMLTPPQDPGPSHCSFQTPGLNCKMPPAEKASRIRAAKKASRGDQESPDACLPPTVPETSAPPLKPLNSQSQKRLAPQPLLSPFPPSVELTIPKTRQNGNQEAPETPLSSELEPFHPKPKIITRKSSRITPFPATSAALEPHPSTSTAQPDTPKPTSQATRGQTNRSSGKTPETVVPTAPELQPSTSTDQPVTPEPIFQATRGRKNRFSVKNPETIVPTAPEPHPSTSTDQPVTPKPTSQATRGKTNRSSGKTPETVVPTAPELQPSTSTDQPVTPEPTSWATRGRTNRSSVKTPESTVPVAPELPPSTSTDQPVTPEPTSRATRGRTNRSSVKTPESTVPVAPELQPSISTDQLVTPEPTSQATRGRKNRSSVKNPERVVPTAPELQASTSTDHPVTPEPTSPATRGRKNRSSVKTPETVLPIASELQASVSTDQPITPEPTSQATRVRKNRSSVKTPETVVPIASELQASVSTDQPITPEPTSQATRVRKNRSSVKTPETVVPIASELQASVSTDQPITPEPTSQATRGRKNRSSVKTPGTVVPIASELQASASTDQPVTPEPTSQATRGRRNRSSVKTPETVVPIASELQASASTDQPVTPEPPSRTSRGRTNRSSVKTPESVVPTAPELQPSTSTDQPVTPEPTSQTTRGRTNRSSVKTLKSVPTAPELQVSTSTDQPVTPEPASRTTRGRTNRSSVKTPESAVPIAPELQPSTSTDQPVTPEPTSRATRGRTNRSSVRTPEPVIPTAPEPLPTTSIDQPVTPKPTSRATRGRVNRSSVKTSKPVEPVASNLEPLIPTDQPVTPEAIAQGGQSKTLRSSIVSAVSVPTTPEFRSPVTTDQPISPEPIPQASCSKRQRVIGNPGSLKAPIDRKPCSAPLEPKSWASRNQRWGAVRETESLTAITEPASPQLLETLTHASQIQKVEARGRSRFTPEPQPKASQSRKRPFATMDSQPLQKQPQREEVSQKTVFLKEELEDTTKWPGKEEDVMTPKPGKRKRDQAEEEPNRIQSRSLRRTKLTQESTAPKVLFTGVVDAQGERAVLALGGSLAGSAAEASHLVTDRIRRTVKFLCALGRGIPILSLDWLHQSRKAGCFLPPDEYVVTDPEQEKNFGFSLQDALSRARERRLLEGYEIHVTPGVQPPPPQMGEIISCCGGTVLPSMPRSYKPQRVVITCPQDFPRCSVPRRVGLPLLSPEFLLTGVLKQEAKPEAFVLSPLEMSST